MLYNAILEYIHVHTHYYTGTGSYNSTGPGSRSPSEFGFKFEETGNAYIETGIISLRTECIKQIQYFVSVSITSLILTGLFLND
jgi:hypothetical protein